MTLRSNTFCWHGISTPVTAGKAFYPRVLGWDLADDPAGPMFVAPGGAVAHIQPPENGPPAWCSFLAVDDLDASTETCRAHGGQVLVGPTDLPVGRFSVVTTPSGAVFGLYQGAESDVLAEPGPGSIHWVELQSTDIATDLTWFSEVFGLVGREQQMQSGAYHVLEADGEPRGGVRASASEASFFVPWVQVDSLDDTLGSVDAEGGQRITPIFEDPTVGRMAVVADPGGASFGIIQPA